MGVSGCGKSTVGKRIASELGAIFIDGDDLHPEINLRKMSAGVPLTDPDRLPWLTVIGNTLARNSRVVIAASALKRLYRDFIRASAPGVFFVYLAIPLAEAEVRVRTRGNHFMPVSLVDSQFTALEPLEPDELGMTLDATLTIEEIVHKARLGLAELD